MVLFFDQFGTNFALRSIFVIFHVLIQTQPQIPLAIMAPTVAFGVRCFKGVKLVVKAELLVLLDISYGKYANHSFPFDSPFSRDTIRVTRVVYKARYIPVESRIDNLPIFCFHHISARRILVLLNALLAYRTVLVEHFTHVLHHKLAAKDLLTSRKTPPFGLRFHRIHVCVLV